MNQANAQLENPAITETVNNGINGFIFVKKRATYIIPGTLAASLPATARPGPRRLTDVNIDPSAI